MSPESEVARHGRTQPASRRSVVVRLVAGALVLLVVVAALTSAPVRHQLTLSFTRVPTTYTELYFDPQLPVADSDRESTTVNFVLHSHEAQTVDYHYVVTGDRGGKSFTAVGTVSLQAGETRQVSAALTPGSTRWTQIGVRLEDRPERISWLADAQDVRNETGAR